MLPDVREELTSLPEAGKTTADPDLECTVNGCNEHKKDSLLPFGYIRGRTKCGSCRARLHTQRMVSGLA